MLEVIGFIALVIIAMACTFGVVVGATLGGWVTGVTIGGSYPPLSERIVGVILILCVIASWYGVYTVAPFEITLKG